MSRAKRVLRALGGGVAVLAGLLGVLIGHVEWKAGRPAEAPYPPIQRDLRPEALARGKLIFDVKCAGCHRAPGAARATGQRMHDIPEPLGHFYTANLTAHPTAGIGSLRDEEIARAVRYGVLADGRKSIMGWPLADADLAAVIGYLRSEDPLFAPDPTIQPKSQPTLVGRAISVLLMGKVPDLPASGIAVPPKEDRLRHGEYLARAVLECVDCHTAGFGFERLSGETAFTGGFEFVGTDGKALFSKNLTFHETGLAGWTKAQFVTALRDGLAPSGQPLRAPMPRFRSIEADDLEAVYDFLKTLPPRESGVPEEHRTPAEAPAPHASLSSEAPALFTRFGCAGCHGEGAAFQRQLQEARGKDVAQLAAWIRHPEAQRPNTQMPSFASVVDEVQARRLAEWISAGR